MHSGFSNLRSALPMNIKAHYPGFKVWAGAKADIDCIATIWRECLAACKGTYLFSDRPCMADAMFAPVVTRFVTYDVSLDPGCTTYCQNILALPPMQEWITAAKADLDRDFMARWSDAVPNQVPCSGIPSCGLRDADDHLFADRRRESDCHERLSTFVGNANGATIKEVGIGI
jgi:hypothetical protein